MRSDADSLARRDRLADARLELSPQDARAAIAEAMMRHPDDLATVREAALVAEKVGDHGQAITLWQRLVRDASLNPLKFRTSRFSAEGHLGIIAGLTHLKRFAEAEYALRRTSRRFPLHPGLLIARGKLAAAREDWDAAIAIWRRVRLLFPWGQHGWDHLGPAVAAKQLAREVEGASTPDRLRPVNVPRVRDEAACKLLLGFESVGDDCEFGMLQRRYGAEPIGLLRWNYVPFNNLLSALEASFAGMGDPEHTELWYADDGSETFIADKRWGLHIHTFTSKAQMDEAAFYPKACRRVAFLRDKFLADLAAGEKIIVYKSPHIGIDGMQALHAAFQKLGKVRVLCVAPSSGGSTISVPRGEPGRAFLVSEGLYLGFIRRFGNVGDGSWNIAFDDWIAVCRAVDSAPPWPGLGCNP